MRYGVGEIIRYYLRNGVKTNDDLHNYLRAIGFNIPRRQFCKEHVAPFDFIADLFFERVDSAIGFANRSGGKTQNVALLNHVDMVFKDHVEVTHAGAVLEQADKCYEYWLDSFTHHELSGLIHDSVKKRSVLTNKSKLEVVAGTVSGLNSKHPQKARIDEVELMEWDVFQEGLSMSQTKNGIDGQDVFTSTRKFAFGTMQKLLESAKDRGIAIYSWCIFETLERCPDEYKCDECPVYDKCQGVAKHCNGWYSINDFIRKVRLLDDDIWSSQWRNLRPERKGAALKNYKDEYPYVLDLKPEDFPKEWRWFSTFDFGYSNPYVRLECVYTPEERVVVVNEYYVRSKTSAKNAKAVNGLWHDESWYEANIVDRSGANYRADLEELGIRTVGNIGEFDESLDELRNALVLDNEGLPKLQILAHCKCTRYECMNYRYNPRSDSERPMKKDDHAIDSMRNLYYWLKKGNAGEARTKIETKKIKMVDVMKAVNRARENRIGAW